MTERIKWVDYSKSFGIFLVVLGHAGLPDNIRSIFYAFHIPLFFFLAGLFFDYDKFSGYFSFFRRRFFQLIVPYLFFNLITYLFWLFIGRHTGKDALTSTNATLPLVGILYGNASSLPHNVPLWFLTCLFTVENLYFILFRTIQNKKTILIIALILLSLIGFIDYRLDIFRLPWGINMGFVVIGFYGIASIFRKQFLKNPNNKLKLIFLSFLAFAIVIVVADVNGKIEVSDHQYGNYLLFFTGAAAGILFIISLSRLLVLYRVNSLFLEYVGRNSLIVFGFHLLAGSFIKAITLYLFKIPLSIYELCYIQIIYSILSISILIPFIFILNKYFPFLIGKTRIMK